MNRPRYPAIEIHTSDLAEKLPYRGAHGALLLMVVRALSQGGVSETEISEFVREADAAEDPLEVVDRWVTTS